MFTIEGRCATAVCYATQIEEMAIEQVRVMCNLEFTRGSSVRIMPDAHAGKGCTIGTTMTVNDAAVPNVVGVDIGCGMYTVALGKIDIDFVRLDEACHHVPSGMCVWEGRQERFDLSELRCFRDLKDTRRLERSLGTLGGGNHFIEVDAAADGTKHLVIHSGSRNLGKQVAEIYQGLAIDQHRLGADFRTACNALIREYKEQGRKAQIQQALEELRAARRGSADDVPDDLCWLSGAPLDDYLHDVAICQAFARRNRELMASIILDRCGITARDAFHTVHNYIDVEERILRKGAIAAHEGELVLIPLNMRDGSVLARGRGNAEWNFSAPHGAGRIMSRTAAHARLSMDDFRAAMEGVYTTCVCPATLDESPAAYKSADDILGPIREAVDVIEVIKPIYNFKATGEGPVRGRH